MALRIRDCCPEGGSVRYNKNGHMYHGQQNYRGKVGGRSFVACPENSVSSPEQRALLQQLLLERSS